MIERIVRDITLPLYEAPKDILEKLNYFRELSATGLHNLTEAEIAHIQKEFNIFFNVNLAIVTDAYPTKLFRLTNNKNLCGGKKQKLQQVSDLLGPPEGLSGIGRCNLAGESVFYSALDFRTVIWEMQPEAGDYITVSEWKIKEGQKLMLHSIFHPKETRSNNESLKAYTEYIEIQKKFDPQLAGVFDEILKFICEEFMKPVQFDQKINYLFSAIISSRFLQDLPDENGFRIDAISYPSIKRDYGVTNVAINNSVVLEKLDLEAITIYTVGDTNYDEKNKDSEDLIKVSALQVRVSEFDFEKNKIVYNAAEELRMMMELVDEQSNNNNKSL
jgi:hypothetical protein